MAELNFCPFCDSPRHKIAVMKDNICFCKECNTFFSINQYVYECYKCSSKRFEDSEFPTPDGELVIQCRKCKKMFSASDFFSKNEEIRN